MTNRPQERRTSLSILSIALLLAGTWAIQPWGPRLIQSDRAFGVTGRICRLDRVVDGDSLRLVCQGKPVEVRLHCIDAPEKDQQPWGDRSREALRSIATQRLELVPIDRDRYGRTVGDVYTLDPKRRLLNLEQVRSGNAAVYDRYCEDPRFFQAEQEARETRRGIWNRKGEHQTPWTFRHRR